MTYASDRGVTMGRRFKVAGPRGTRRDINASTGVKIGDIVTMNRDDNTDTPYFDKLDATGKIIAGSVLIDLSATNLTEIFVSDLTFDEEEVKKVVTVIRAGRVLNQAEKEAIAAIIEKGIA